MNTFEKSDDKNIIGYRKSSFDHPHFMERTKASLEHLTSLNLDPLFENSTVLEVGSGVGILTHYFENLNCKILSTDGRKELVAEHQRRYPNRKVEIADLELSETYKKFDKFDIVFCYGTLYHLSNPELPIRNFAKITQKIFLLETCVNTIDNSKVNLVEEPKYELHQSIYGIGCRPSRDWIMSKLKRYFPYSYITATQPRHAEYALEWPVKNPVELTRCIFVASQIKLENPNLLENLPERQYYW